LRACRRRAGEPKWKQSEHEMKSLTHVPPLYPC
jgi:hypothetical protein